MSTDLTKVQDHPVAVLKSISRPYSGEAPDTPIGHDLKFAADAVHMVITGAAKTLSDYEVEHNVTFVALDNDALTIVREAYERVENSLSYDPERMVALNDLYTAIGPLLGLGE